MFKNGFFYIAIMALLVGGAGCSSNSTSGEDLDISEIQEIEATGEFSEEEFFSDGNEVELAKEEQLVDEVPGLESELADDVVSIETGEASTEQEVGADLEIDASSEDELFADLDLDLGEESQPQEEEGGINSSKNVTVQADDLGFEEEGVGFEGEVSAGEEEVADLELDTDDAEDLFRDNETVADASEFEDVSIDDTFTDVSVESDYSAQAEVQEPITEDVSTIETDFAAASNEDASAAELLEEDVTIDVDYTAAVQDTGAQDNYTAPAVAASPSTGSINESRGLVSVKKMKTVPYTKNGVLVNAIYFVRDGDSLRSIADKIYGRGSAVDFRIVNPHLTEGALRVGQKVYYNSPMRSQDRSRLLTYYEDISMPNQIYSAQSGENIRTISKNLLGHPRSWMEVWATNQQIESKTELGAPYQIRYWNGYAGSPAPTLASNTPPPSPSPNPVNNTPPPAPEQPQQNFAANNNGAPDSSSQASLNLDTNTAQNNQPVAQQPAEVNVANNDVPEFDDSSFDEPDMELNEPAEVAMDEGFDDLSEEELMGEGTMDEDLAGIEPQETAAVGAVEGRKIARNQGAFPVKGSDKIFGQDRTRVIIVGGALLLLLALGFVVARRRKGSASAVEMESFDFGGETSVESENTKTQIDL